MLENKAGQPVPQVTFRIRQGDAWTECSSTDIFTNKTVVLFALPGAFTPTCSSAHLPRYNELAPVFKDNGVDSIICLSVNDAFVMDAWKEEQKAGHVIFLPDGNGDFSEGIGMLVNKHDLGFGRRSWRYSMLVKNGVIEKMFIEPDEPGDPFKVSDADTMLNYINPHAVLPSRITLFTKPGCPHCSRAKAELNERALDFEVIELGQQGISYSSLVAVSGAGTTPQVFINGRCIGGADQLEEWLRQQ